MTTTLRSTTSRALLILMLIAGLSGAVASAAHTDWFAGSTATAGLTPEHPH